ncbi:MAG: GNAT family N-acetyltransferase [Bacteroidales bacterium]
MLKKQGIALRPPELKDLEILYKWENDHSLWHLSNTLVPFSKYILEQYILQNNHDIFIDKQLRLMIDIKESNTTKTVGSIDLFEFDPFHQRAGIGILIDKTYRKKGLASKALDMLIQYSFNTLNLHQLYCNILDNNTESLKLFKNKGFEEIGIKRDWRKINGQWEDELIFQLIGTD